MFAVAWAAARGMSLPTECVQCREAWHPFPASMLSAVAAQPCVDSRQVDRVANR